MEHTDPRAMHQVRDELSVKIMDLRALITALESLHANSEIGEDGSALTNSEAHTLLIIARDRVREADTLTDKLEFMMPSRFTGKHAE